MNFMKKKEPTKKDLLKCFKTVAKEHDCDESPEAFEGKLKKLATVRPMTNKDVKSRRGKK